MVPGVASGRKIPGELVELYLLLGFREEFDEFPGSLFFLGVAEDDQAGSSRQRCTRCARSIWGRKRSCVPPIFHPSRKTSAELSDVPWAGDEHGKVAFAELLVDVGNLTRTHDGSVPAAERLDVEIEATRKRRLAECPVAVSVPQEPRALLHSQQNRLRPFVRGEENRVLSFAEVFLDVFHGAEPFAPRRGRFRPSRGGQNVGAIEQNAGIDVPGNAIDLSVDHVGCPDSREEILRL